VTDEEPIKIDFRLRKSTEFIKYTMLAQDDTRRASNQNNAKKIRTHVVSSLKGVRGKSFLLRKFSPAKNL